MPIKWSALKVSEAMDMVEEQVNLAIPYLEQAKIVATEARRIANLPGYIDDRLARFIGEVDRAIGGSHLEPVGRLKAGIKAVRGAIPDGAIEEEQKSTKHGSQQAMI